MLNKRALSLLGRKFLLFLVAFTYLSAAAAAQTDVYTTLETPFYDPNSSSVSSDCQPLSGTPGKGAPDGAQFPNLDLNAMASAINQWIQKENPKSMLSGLGSTVVAGAQKSNVSPFLIVAIAGQESSLSDPSDWNVAHANNSFGRTAAAGQPSVQGSRAWYRWSSVKASVDYTAAENQNVSGGGDIAAYIRNVYSSELDSSNLLALFLKYAPAGDGNNPQQYAAKVTSWINELVALTTGQSGTSTAGATASTTSCNGVYSGDIVKTAMGFAWPSGDHGPNKQDATSAYQTGMPQYNNATSDYSDCGGFVATVMHASGADKDYVGVYVPNQYNYVAKSTTVKYQIIKGVKDTSNLQPGDILIYINPSNPGDSHTFIYVGKQSNFDGDGAAASLGGHVPEAVSTAASFSWNGRASGGNYMAVRLVQ